MKKRLLAMLLALMLVVGLLPVGVLAAGASNEYGSLEYDNTNQSPLQGTLSVVFQDANGQQLGDPIVVTDYEKTFAAENKIILTGDEYEIAEISASNGLLTSVSVNGTTGSFHLTFANAASATVYVTLAEPFDKDDVVLEGEEIGHGGVVYFNINDYEIYKMLYIAGVSVPASPEIDSVKLRYVKENLQLETEDFVELSGFISTEYVDYWQADASNGSGLATPYNVRQLEIEHHDTTTVIPYTALKYTKDGNQYWIEARNDAPYIVAFYNETSADSGNDYTLYDIRYVDISGETVAENGGMPADPDYPNTTYQFVAWTDEYDGGKPFIETTPVTEDTVVYAQKTLSTNASEIHVMNDGDLFKDRIQELYNRNDINWNSVKVSVYAEDGSYTNPDYNISPNANGWRGNYYFVYNYLSGVGEQENDSVFINDITHIVVTANATDGSYLDPITINKGIYDGDFSVSTGAQGSSYIIELYINDNGVEDPDEGGEEPGPVAELDVDKTVAIPDGKDTAAVGDVLKYTVTITNTGLGRAEGVIVTDTMWTEGSSVKIGGKDGQLQSVTAGEDGYYVTVNVPANDSVDIYYTYTVPETDAGNTVKNTVTVGNMSDTIYTTVDEAEEPEEPGKPQTVQVVIYRNGDITKPYATIYVPGYKTGDTIYTKDFNINDYYTKDKFATDFVFDGWFDDGRWNNYKVAGCPEDGFTTVDEIYVNGWKNVIAMVWDVYPVNYHVLDEDGNEIDNKTDYITERDLAGYELWDYSKAGHTFDGWYENDKEIGNDSKKEPVPLAPLKKYELYGLCDPIPQHLEIYAAIDKNKEEAVKIYSDMVDYGTSLVAYLETLELETDIFPGYSPEDGKWYKYDSPKWTFGENDTVSGWTKVLINYVPNEYTIYYHGSGGVTESGAEQSTSTFKYGSEAKIKNNPFTYEGYVFEGWALSADGEVVFTGGQKIEFTESNFPGLLANDKVDLYAVWAEDKIGTEDPSEGDGVPDKYQATVNFVAGNNGKVTGEVTKVYTIFGADGQYAKEGVITPSLEGVTVTPDEGYKVDGWTNAVDERVDPESEITVEGGEVVVFTVNFQSNPSLKEITSFEKKLVTDRETYHNFRLRVPTFIRNGSTVVVDEGKGVTLLYAISLTGTPGAEYAITDTGADVADGYALTGVIPETGVVTVYVTKDFTWREAATAAYKDDALVNTAAVELTDNPNEPGQESTETVDVDIDWDYNPPVVDDDDEDEDDEVFVPNWLNTTDHYAYIVGYEDGEVKPNNNITRAEVATIFFRLLTDDARAYYWSTDSGFSDVKPGDWYNNAVSTMVNAGILNGYSDGTFQPNANITRAEFATIAARFLSNSYSLNDRFYDTEGHWAEPYINRAAEVGWINGYNDGSFKPDQAITRAEAVTLVNAVLGREPHEDHLLSRMVTWPDNPKSAWYYEDIQEATNSHDYVWASGNAYEIWTKLLENRNWAKLEKEWSNAYSAPGGNVMG